MIKIDDSDMVFMAEVESYVNRKVHFVNYSPLEFECIVELLKEKEPSDNSDAASKKRRVKNLNFNLGNNYPLQKCSIKAFLRTTFCVAILSGKPIPKCSKTF